MSTTIYQVDAFTDEPFKGNPAGVCLLEEARPDEWMQAIAAEMNLSETAFLRAEEGGYRLRWFTPTTEVELCGHATLASAHVLWEAGHLDQGQEAVFHTLSGVLKARLDMDEIVLDFPRASFAPAPAVPGLEQALGAPLLGIHQGGHFLLVEMESEAIVRGLQPDFARLKAVSPDHGVIVTSEAASDGYDFVSRCFAPNVGLNEDPVTGSAHCLLGPFWNERLGRDELMAYQASARGGSMRVRVGGDRVYLAGIATTVLRATLMTD